MHNDLLLTVWLGEFGAYLVLVPIDSFTHPMIVLQKLEHNVCIVIAANRTERSIISLKSG